MPFYISLWPGWILVVGLGIFIQAHEVEAKTVVSFFGAQDVPLAASNKAAISAVHVAGYRDPLGIWEKCTNPDILSGAEPSGLLDLLRIIGRSLLRNPKLISLVTRDDCYVF